MPAYRRTERINQLLKQEIATVVREEVRDPRACSATVTAVQASPELDHATVYVTTLGGDEERRLAVEGLTSAGSFIRGQLGRSLRLRRIPELHFEVDRKLEEAARVERLLRGLGSLQEGGGSGESA
ncbi:MAG: 30S ribosome-binding factor RbfA [Longimicrobiaceae bacterium]